MSDDGAVHRIDETGKRYGKLTVISVLHRTTAERFKCSKAKWICLCDCGMRTAVFGNKLRSGTISRCLRCEKEMRSKPMDTLVKRLRKEQQWGNALDGEAAARIEALEKQNGKLKEMFRVHMLRLMTNLTHEDIDNHIEEVLK